MNNDFGNRVYPVIRYVIGVLEQVRSGAQNVAGASEVASRLKTLLSQFDVEGVRSTEFDLAKRALVYWVDEVLINSRWEEAGWWSNHTLERHFYDSRERAWRFFEKAAVARQLENLDALETFYLCACLGFWGTYRDRKSGTAAGEKSTSDSWPGMPPAKDGEKQPDGAEAPPPNLKQSMSWWGGDMDEVTNKTWGLAHTSLDLSRLKLERIGSSSARETTDDPETLKDWIESVYRQIAPAPPDPYSPLGSPQVPGDASPLTGQASRVWALMSVLLASTFLIMLLVITLYRA